jgi:hypothetical protein
MVELYFKFKKLKARLVSIETILHDILLRLDGINLKLVIIEGKEDKIMSQVAQDFESLRVALNDATNKVADKITQLTSSIKNSMTDAEVSNLKAGFGTVADQLNALAADPSDPVPSQPLP